MSDYKIFYLDDEKDDLIQPLKSKLEAKGLISVEVDKPRNFENEQSRLIEILEDYDALILDLQLDGPQVNEENGEPVLIHYQAPPLAQTIRTLATDGKIADLPIILCSTEQKIKATFDRDFTSHDLFDWTFLKDEINESTIQKIIAIILGYQKINKIKNNFSELLNYDFKNLDERILSRFANEENIPTHEIAREIMKDIVQPNGVLINEHTLIARLGIDVSKTGDDWITLRNEFFSKSKYQGIYCESWNRWWNDMVIDVFEELTEQNLASLDAESRVNLLIEKTGLKSLFPASPIEFCTSIDFWNICEITKHPLDPFEGFRMKTKEEPKAWQDYPYVSLYGFVTQPDKVKKMGIKIHPADMEKMKEARKKID